MLCCSVRCQIHTRVSLHSVKAKCVLKPIYLSPPLVHRCKKWSVAICCKMTLPCRTWGSFTNLKKKSFIYRDIYKMYDWSNWFRPWYFIWILKTPAFRPNIDIGVWKCKIVVTGSTIDKLLFRKGLQALDTGGKLCCNRPHFLTIARPNLPSVIAVNWPRSSKFSVTEDVRRPLLDRICFQTNCTGHGYISCDACHLCIWKVARDFV